MNHVTLSALLLRRARLLTVLDEFRDTLGPKAYRDLRQRVELAHTQTALDWVQLNLCERRVREQFRKERAA
jgi:hypothetical protein